jgi:tetratricopeptide (TPR) repeat protein
MMTLATLSNLNEAYLLRSMLEASEIPAFIPDENTCQTVWTYINAIGGVRVQIPEEFAKEAASVLNDFKSGFPDEVAETAGENPDSADATMADALPGSSDPANDAPKKYAAWGPLTLLSLYVSIAAAVAIAATYGHRAMQVSTSAYSAGYAAYRKGDYSVAAADFSRALESYPKDAHIYVMRGLAYDNLGKYDGAIADYSQAILLDPSDPSAHVARGKAYSDKGDQTRSVADATQAILLDPKDTQAWFNRGDAYFALGQYDKAIADFGQAIHIDPRDGNAYFNRGWAYDETGDFAKAIADYSAVIQIDPNSNNAYNALAWDLATSPDANIRDGKKAVEYATKACELSGWKDGPALDTLAAACAEAGDFQNAVNRENASLGIPNQNPGTLAEGKERLKLYEANKPYHAGK